MGLTLRELPTLIESQIVLLLPMIGQREAMVFLEFQLNKGQLSGFKLRFEHIWYNLSMCEYEH